MLNASALSAWVTGIKSYLECRLGSQRQTPVAWCCSYGCSAYIPVYLNSHPRRFSLIMYNAPKFKSPGSSDDQAEGCHVLSLSHSGKWIPLPRVISVSYNKKLIHNVTRSEMQNYSQGSLQGCAGAIRILPLGPWWVPLSPIDPGSSIINLPVNMHDLGLVLTLHNAQENLKMLPHSTPVSKKMKYNRFWQQFK